jgi:hypothetical protein
MKNPLAFTRHYDIQHNNTWLNDTEHDNMEMHPSA